MLIKLFMFACLGGRGLSFSRVYLFHILLIIIAIKEFSISTLKSFLRSEKPLILMLIYSALSLFWTNSLLRGAQDVIYLLLGISVIYLISTTKKPMSELVKVICGFSWLNLAISAAESLEFFRYPISNYSKFGPLFGMQFYGENLSVPTGFFVNPNDNAFFILIFSPIVLTAFKKIPAIIYLLIASFVVFMASSKMILVAWIIAVFIMLYGILVKRLGLIKTSGLFLGMVVLIGSLLLFSEGQRMKKYSKTIPALKTFLTDAPLNLIDRLQGEDVKFDYVKYDISLHERLVFMDGIAKILRGNWLFGSGAGSLHDSFSEQAGIKLSLRYPHFYFMEIAAKYGIFFLIAYLFWIFKITRKAVSINPLFALSIILFVIFSPVIGSATYFIPKWALYGVTLKLANSKEANQ